MIDLAERIRRSQFSVTQISNQTGIPAERITEIISGVEPSLRELRLLAQMLGLAIDDFLPATVQERRAEVLFRERAAHKRKADAPVAQFTKRVGGALELLGSEAPSASLADFPTPPQTYAGAEVAAAEFRRRFLRDDQLSPLITLPSLLVNDLDLLVFVGSERAFDGGSAVLGGHIFIFVAAQFKPRMLFTLAHEVAHLLAHHKDRELVVLDAPEDVRDFPTRNQRKEEAFADAFASALLLPQSGLGVALKKIKALLRAPKDRIGDVEILYLSRIFGVSFEAAARRCEDLGLLPRGGARSLYEHLRKEYGSPEKRAEALGLPPRPEIEFPPLPPHLVDRAIRRIRAGEISIGRASRILNIAIPDIFVLHTRS
jgi:uncharacterized protein DUF955